MLRRSRQGLAAQVRTVSKAGQQKVGTTELLALIRQPSTHLMVCRQCFSQNSGLKICTQGCKPDKLVG